MFQYPLIVALDAGTETVLVALDLPNRNFVQGEPTYYFSEPGCSGARMLYVDLLRIGAVSNGQLYYPTGTPQLQSYQSYLEAGECTTLPDPASSTFAAVGSRSVASFVAPFKISR